MKALLLERLGNHDAALRGYQAALRADPNQTAARDSLKRLGAAPPAETALKQLPAQETEKGTAIPDPLPSSVFIGRWHGEVIGLNDTRLGDYRTLTITRVEPNGSAAGRWAASVGGGQGTTVRLTGNGLHVVTNKTNRVTLRAVTKNRLEGTFIHLRTGRRLRVTMARQ
jgi:hypothetical protein